MALTAVLDARVLYSATLHDLLVSVAFVDLFRARWTEAFNDEWTRRLKEKRPELAEKIDRTRELMNVSVPGCLIRGHELVKPSFAMPDPNDWHVVAAAIRGRADVIVTYVLAHFPTPALDLIGIKVQHPDDFIVLLCHLDGCELLRHRAAGSLLIAYNRSA